MAAIDVALRRGIKKAMLQHVSGFKREQYLHVLRALQSRRSAVEAAFTEMLGSIPKTQPVTFLVPGRSGRFLFRPFWEYVRELERGSERIMVRAKPVAITLPLRPRRIYYADDRSRIPLSPVAASEVARSVILRNPLFLRVFESARRGERALVYLDPYEFSGKTRKTYEILAKNFGVPNTQFHSVVLTHSANPEVRAVGELIDSISGYSSWLDMRERHLDVGGQKYLVHHYVRPEKDLMERRVWW